MAETLPEPTESRLERERWRLLRRIDSLLDRPLVFLGFVWLGLTILELTVGVWPILDPLAYLIWAVFVVDFAIGMVIAPAKLTYLRTNWLTVLSLFLPAFRILRVLRPLRMIGVAKAARSVTLLRVVTSLNRGMGALGRTLQRRGVGFIAGFTVLVTLGGAAGMLSFENPRALAAAGLPEDAAARGLGGYGEALWWTAMLVTTMGSEYWPKTPEGRLLCLLLAVYAFAFFGYITATIAGHFVGRDEEQRKTATARELAALRAEIAELRKLVGPPPG